MEIGAKIKTARIAKGLTQEELGKLVGVQKSAIAKYENGRVVNIKRSTLQGLANALGLKGSDLISDIGDADTKKEKSTAAYDGLSKDKIELIEQIKSLPEEKIQLLLQVARSIK
jgi:transcriptional regulator with XRE-family HTH domain